MSVVAGKDAEGRDVTLAPDDKPGAPPGSTDSPKDTDAQIAEQAKQIADLTEKVGGLDASNRSYQGQVRSLEARLNQPPQVVEPEADPLEGVDLTDPDQAKIVSELKRLAAENVRLRTAATTTAATADNRSQREAWIALYQSKFATPLGLDPNVVEQAARKIPPNTPLEIFAETLADEVTALLKGPDSPADAIAKAKREGEVEALKQLEEQGLYKGAEAQIRGGVAPSAATMTAAQLAAMTTQQVADAHLTKEQLRAILKRK